MARYSDAPSRRRPINCVYDYNPKNPKFVDVQLELEGGDIVIGGYELVAWRYPPQECREHMHKAQANGPVGTAGFRK